MSRALLVLRPGPGAGATAARAGAAGWIVTKAPLFDLVTFDWSAPDYGYDALLLTSANAVRLGGPGLVWFQTLPAYAVGGATEAAAREAGFMDVRAGSADSAALLDKAARDGVRRLLHLAGREHHPLDHPALAIDRRIVYGADAVAALPDRARDALGEGAIALLHSPRAAAIFAALVDNAGIDRAAIAIAAISAPALAQAGSGWRAATAAATPDDEALLAAAARLCE